MSWGRKGDIFCEVAAAARLEFWQWPDFASTLALELWEGEEGRAVRWVYESDRPVPFAAGAFGPPAPSAATREWLSVAELRARH